jgi:hypothetical protein
MLLHCSAASSCSQSAHASSVTPLLLRTAGVRCVLRELAAHDTAAPANPTTPMMDACSSMWLAVGQPDCCAQGREQAAWCCVDGRASRGPRVSKQRHRLLQQFCMVPRQLPPLPAPCTFTHDTQSYRLGQTAAPAMCTHQRLLRCFTLAGPAYIDGGMGRE